MKRSSGTNGVPQILVNANPNVAHIMDFSAPNGSSSTQLAHCTDKFTLDVCQYDVVPVFHPAFNSFNRLERDEIGVRLLFDPQDLSLILEGLPDDLRN